METQDHLNFVMHFNHVLDNYRTEKIAEIESRVSMARANEHGWCLLKCNYSESGAFDNVKELIHTTLGKLPVDDDNSNNPEFTMFNTAIIPVMNHFQTRGYTVELVEHIGQCDLILRW